MTFQKLKDDFYHTILSELELFSRTDENKAIYALAFDCDSSVGQTSLRYGNEQNLRELIEYYTKDDPEYFDDFGINGLNGFRYDVGDFSFVGSIEQSGYRFLNIDSDTKHFLDSYYYYAVGEYYGEGEPLETLDSGEVLSDETVEPLFWELVLDCINRLKENISFLDTTDNFIIYMCDHEQSEEDYLNFIRKTVDEELFNKLLAESDIKE